LILRLSNTLICPLLPWWGEGIFSKWNEYKRTPSPIYGRGAGVRAFIYRSLKK